MKAIFSFLILISILPSSISKKKENYDGMWLLNSYLEKIEASKSIYINRDYEPLIWGFNIYKDSLENGKLFHGFTHHEGGLHIPFMFYKHCNCYETDYNRVDEYFSTKPIKLSLIEPNLLEFDYLIGNNYEYRRVKGIQEELRRILFEGKYSTEKGSHIHFEISGNITGFKDYKYFEVIHDFTLGIRYDAIIFFQTEQGRNYSYGDIYTYKIDGQKITLHKVDTEWEEFNHIIRKEPITLTKK